MCVQQELFWSYFPWKEFQCGDVNNLNCRLGVGNLLMTKEQWWHSFPLPFHFLLLWKHIHASGLCSMYWQKLMSKNQCPCLAGFHFFAAALNQFFLSALFFVILSKEEKKHILDLISRLLTLQNWVNPVTDTAMASGKSINFCKTG